MSASLLSIFKALKNVYGPQRWWPADTPFEVIVGAILTQNTSWNNVVKAIHNLKAKDLLCEKRLLKLNKRSLARLIRPAGYYNVKAERLKNFLIFMDKEAQGSLRELLKGPVNVLRERLLRVNGIGPETADSIILYAAGKPVFVVDAYTKRIFSKLGMVKADADYGTVQKYFESRMPKDHKLFNEFHALIVRLAKEVCVKKPRCKQCPIHNKCQYFSSNS